LGDAVVCGIKDLGAPVIASVVDFPEQPFISWPASSVVIGECVHVFQDEIPGPGFCQNAGISLKEGRIRI
jgi:hypothetical protein